MNKTLTGCYVILNKKLIRPSFHLYKNICSVSPVVFPKCSSPGRPHNSLLVMVNDPNILLLSTYSSPKCKSKSCFSIVQISNFPLLPVRVFKVSNHLVHFSALYQRWVLTSLPVVMKRVFSYHTDRHRVSLLVSTATKLVRDGSCCYYLYTDSFSASMAYCWLTNCLNHFQLLFWFLTVWIYSFLETETELTNFSFITRFRM